MKTKFTSIRSLNFFAFLACFGLLGFAVYLQTGSGLEPCPLCIIQRLLFVFLALLFLVGSTLQLQHRAHTVYQFFISFIAFIGVAAAGKQVYLTQLPPDQVPPCGPGLSYMLDNLPFFDVLSILIRGTGECAAVTWRFLSLSIPEWSLIFFCFFALLSLAQALRET